MLIQGSKRPLTVVTLLATNWVITDMGAGGTEPAAMFRTKVDLSGFTEARITAGLSVAGSTNAELRVRYSTDDSTFAYLNIANTGPKVNIAGTGTRVGSWVTIDAAARADVFLQLLSINGDGVADPAVRLVTLQLR